MLNTFHTEYEKLEIKYSNGKSVSDHVNVLRDCGVFIERCINYFITNFHSSLEHIEEREKYLEFERGLEKPVAEYNTIGVFIGLLKKLELEFSSHSWIKSDLAVYLGKANLLRNKYAHSNIVSSIDSPEMKMKTELESDDMIYYAQQVMLSFGFKDKFIHPLGYNLSVFLIYTSIKDKFTSAHSEIHYEQIIHDAHKILPEIIKPFLDKIYTNVNISDKEQILKILSFNKSIIENDEEIKTVLSEFVKINWKLIIDKKGEELLETIGILLNRPTNKKKSYALRYLSAIDLLMDYLKNEMLTPILKFADKVKKKYLENGNVIEENDKAYFDDLSEDLKISPAMGEKIINRVINTIENKIITFQTFNKENSNTHKINIEKETTNLFKYACLKLNDNNCKGAIQDFTEIIELKYNIAFYYIYRGIAYETTGEIEKAENDFSEALKINSRREFFYYNKALAKFEINNYEGTIEELNKALKYKNNDPDIYFYKGEALRLLSRLQDASVAYRKALEILPKHSGASLRLEKLQKNRSYIEERRQKKKNISAHFNYACKKLNDKEYQKAIVDFNLIIDIEPNIAFYYIYRAIANELSANNAAAEKDLEYALKINPRKDFHFYNRGLARIEAADYTNAIKEFNEAIALKNNEADYYYFQGLAYEKLENLEQAKVSYHKTLEINPRHTEAPRNIEKISFNEKKQTNDNANSLYVSNLFRYVCSKFNDRDFEEALKDLNEIIRLKPKNAFYFVFRGVAKELLQLTQESHDDFTMALALNPSKDFFYFNKGVAFFEAGCSERAVRQLNTAIKINDQVPDFYFYKALVYESSGEIEKAIFACDNTLDSFPAHTEAKRKRSKLVERQIRAKKQMETKMANLSNALEFFENARCLFAEESFQEAINELNKAIQILPDSAFYYIYKAVAFEKLQKYEKANKNYKIARGINLSLGMFCYHKAKAEFDIGDYENALAEINKAIKLKEKFAFVNYRLKIYKKIERIDDYNKDKKKSLKLQQKENLSQMVRFN